MNCVYSTSMIKFGVSLVIGSIVKLNLFVSTSSKILANNANVVGIISLPFFVTLFDTNSFQYGGDNIYALLTANFSLTSYTSLMSNLINSCIKYNLLNFLLYPINNTA